MFFVIPTEPGKGDEGSLVMYSCCLWFRMVYAMSNLFKINILVEVRFYLEKDLFPFCPALKGAGKSFLTLLVIIAFADLCLHDRAEITDRSTMKRGLA